MLTHRLVDSAPPRRVVVIGGHGFIGGAIVDRLRDSGIDTRAVGRDDVDLLLPNAAERLATLLRAGDVVVAVAARAPCKNVDMLVDNAILTRAIIGALAAVAVSHLVNISSDAVYGDEQGPLSERLPPSPATLHGAMHLAREIAFATLAAPLAILRPTLVYGARDPHDGYGPNRFRRLAAANRDIVLFGAGEERRDHVLVTDLADIVRRVILRRSTGVLNVATGDVHSFRAVAELAVEAAGSGSAIRATPRQGPMPHNGYRPFDPAATHAAFPDFGYITLPDGMRRVQAEDAGRKGIPDA